MAAAYRGARRRRAELRARRARRATRATNAPRQLASPRARAARSAATPRELRRSAPEREPDRGRVEEATTARDGRRHAPSRPVGAPPAPSTHADGRRRAAARAAERRRRSSRHPSRATPPAFAVDAARERSRLPTSRVRVPAPARPPLRRRRMGATSRAPDAVARPAAGPPRQAHAPCAARSVVRPACRRRPPPSRALTRDPRDRRDSPLRSVVIHPRASRSSHDAPRRASPRGSRRSARFERALDEAPRAAHEGQANGRVLRRRRQPDRARDRREGSSFSRARPVESSPRSRSATTCASCAKTSSSASAASLAFENGRLATGEGEFVPVVQLRGDGAVLLEAMGEILTLDVQADRSLSVRREVVLGWFGRLVPRALAPERRPVRPARPRELRRRRPRPRRERVTYGARKRFSRRSCRTQRIADDAGERGYANRVNDDAAQGGAAVARDRTRSISRTC